MDKYSNLSFEELHDLLETLHDRYNRAEFIEPDPISIPHSFERTEDKEIAGFLAAIARGEDYPKALARAVAFGASACMEEGSLPPMPENIAAMLDVITVKPCDI